MYKKFTTNPQTDVQFLKTMGLKPSHKILDIGCGGGRLGNELINYLNTNNYYAFDKESNWISEFRKAIIQNNLTDKKPTILLSDFSWSLEDDVKFDYVYAYSVFTHVGPDLVKQCLNNLKKHMTSSSKFYTTLIVKATNNGFSYNRTHPERRNEYLQARYDVDYFNDIIQECGYDLEPIPPNYKDPVGPGNHEDANLAPDHKIFLLKIK